MIIYFSDFRYVDPFWRYSRSNRKLSESAQNFGRFFGHPKFLGAGLPKIVPSLSLLHRGTSTEKSFVRILPVVRKLLSLTQNTKGKTEDLPLLRTGGLKISILYRFKIAIDPSPMSRRAPCDKPVITTY